jgi:cytochrome c-type biogenesis protein
LWSKTKAAGDRVEFYQIILVPVAFGLLGFVEPCSIGANIIFLGYLQARKAGKVSETIKFTITRALFLGLVGLLVGVVGQPMRTGTYSYSLLLGGAYVVLGLLGLWWSARGTGFAPLDLGRYLPKEGAFPLGVVFGLTAPACSLPLFLALLGLGVTEGAWVGFLSLFLFGLALSVPLVLIAHSAKAEEILRSLGRKATKVPYLAGLVLISVGSITILIAWRQLSTV